MITAVTSFGSGIYEVVSSPNEKHTVDLRAYSLNGSCTCSVFTGCCAPIMQYQRGGKRWRCDHINAVRQWVMEYEYPDLIDRTEKIIELPTEYERPAAESEHSRR